MKRVVNNRRKGKEKKQDLEKKKKTVQKDYE